MSTLKTWCDQTKIKRVRRFNAKLARIKCSFGYFASRYNNNITDTDATQLFCAVYITEMTVSPTIPLLLIRVISIMPRVIRVISIMPRVIRVISIMPRVIRVIIPRGCNLAPLTFLFSRTLHHYDCFIHNCFSYKMSPSQVLRRRHPSQRSVNPRPSWQKFSRPSSLSRCYHQ